MIGHPLLATILSNMAWSCLAMLLVLAVRRPFAALFGAGPAYALWLLPALRLLAPPLPAWSPWASSVALPANVILVAEDAAAPMPPLGGPGQWVPILLALWAVGAAVFIAWQILVYRRFLCTIEQEMRVLGRYGGATLIESGAVVGPVAFGLLSRRIVVPADFESRYSPAERLLALDHEAIHHRRGDLWWNHLALLVLAAHWFNPIAWIAFRAFRADQELACDAAIAAKSNPEQRHDYGRALVKSASRPGLIAACPLNHADQLKRRLKMIKLHTPDRGRFAAGLSLVALLGVAGLGLSGGASAQPQAETPAPQTRESMTVRTEERGKSAQVLIMTDRRGPRHAAAAAPAGKEPTKVQTFKFVRKGDAAASADGTPDLANPEAMAGMMAKCDPADRTEINQDESGGKTRIVLCTKGDGTPASRADSLQRARDMLAGNDNMKGEQRDRTLAAIDKEITRLRGQQ